MGGSPSGDAAVSGGAGRAILPHRTEMENDCSLNASDLGLPEMTGSKCTCLTAYAVSLLNPEHSGNSGFPFLLTLGATIHL